VDIQNNPSGILTIEREEEKILSCLKIINSDLTSTGRGTYLEVDVWIHDIKLSFEYQVSWKEKNNYE
jgi:hypothetical protein